jgi:Alternate to MurJ
VNKLTIQLIIIIILTIIIHATETLTYGIRLGGIRLKKIAVALSLTGIVLLIARTSNMFQAPIIGVIVDRAKVDPTIDVLAIFHIILISASIGTLLALFLYPTGARLAMLMIERLEIDGSAIALMKTSNIYKLKRTSSYIRRPRFEMIHILQVGGIPKRIMLINMVVTAIYTTGVLSALYASILNPAHSTTANMATGVVNGFATILLTLLLDPQIALMTERALNKENGADEIAKTYGWLMIARFFGTLLAHLLLLPSAWLISWISSIIG